ncbi:NfeD family protein [Budvicia diplopodorum]|uniref:NfeD family protein n=1 Tax=Budvicia diplopodorum TaxID=1119056 RepID=UPI003CCDC482
MFEDLIVNPYHFWLILGGLLLAAELIGAYGYLLWSGVSAIIIGAISWLIPMSWGWQWAGFSALTMVVAILWWYWLKSRAKSETRPINEPNRLLIGKKLTLAEPIVHGVGRIVIADGSWRIQCSQDLPAGAEIRIVAVESITLIVEPTNALTTPSV